MKLKIIQGSKYKEIKELLINNNNYCPCSIVKNEDTKCMCKEFREQETEGECHCMAFKKVMVEE